MKLTKEQIIILIFATSFFVVSFLYIQSLGTIKRMYKESSLQNLETVSIPSSDLASTSTISIDNNQATSSPVVSTGTVPIQEPDPAPINNEPDLGCYVGGCSGQLCGDASIKDVATTCEWRDTYACYQDSITTCERQADGKCGWTMTKDLNECLANPVVLEVI